MLRDQDPHGTVEELLKIGVDLTKVGSCSRKRRDEDNKVAIIGCPVRKWCDLPEKEGKGPPTSGNNGAGPCRKGLLVIKVLPDGTKVPTRVVMDCFHIPGLKRRIETPRNAKSPGGVVRVIASEGEEIELPGSEAKDVTIPGQGLQRQHIAGIYKDTVKKFPRPGTAYNLPGQQIVVEETARARAELHRTAPARLLGVEDDDGTEIPEARP